MLWTEHVNIRHLGFSKCYVVYYEVKCPFWLRRHFTSKLGKPFHLTLNCIMRQLSFFFLMAPNFLALATTLENLGARRLLAKKVNFGPCIPQFLKTMDNKHNSLNFAAKICSDICPWTLSVPRSSQFSSSFALRKLFASQKRQCPRTNIQAYFRAKWRLLFIYNLILWLRFGINDLHPKSFNACI